MLETAAPTRKFARVCDILESHQHDPAKLIPILHAVQEEYRYLPEEVMTFVATSLGVPPSRVFGVATFYSHFALTPKGKHIIKICDGTACHVKKSTGLLDTVREVLGLAEGQTTTSDMMFTLEMVSCLGACGLAPVIVVDDEVHGQMTPAKVQAVVEKIMKSEENNNGAQ